LIMKCVIHDEMGPRHWHDALGLIAAGKLDWGYLKTRSYRAPRRILSLLIYAHSLDMHVPNELIAHLYQQVYGKRAGGEGVAAGGARRARPPGSGGGRPQLGTRRAGGAGGRQALLDGPDRVALAARRHRSGGAGNRPAGDRGRESAMDSDLRAPAP